MKNNKTVIHIPEYVNKISDWPDFHSVLPSGKVIVNKKLTGCGMTHYYLTNELPVILVAPRRILILNKLNDSLIHNLHYFDADSIPDKEERIKSLEKYLSVTNDTPFGFKPPKILVTYDSFPFLTQVLKDRNRLDEFIIIIDEFTCIFTDARYKGLTEMKLLKRLESIANQCIFVSATPINEVYLEEVEELQDAEYIDLVWSDSKISKVTIVKQKMKSPYTAICGIIEEYRKNGFFKYDDRHGTGMVSKEAVFFINSISDIVKVIKKMRLTSQDTRIIWADTTKNNEAIKKINENLTPSQKFTNDVFPSRDTYTTENKPITLVTRAASEGADLYSDSATIYIFADPNKDNLGLDISIDICQIIGRCRTESNPFRDLVYFYIKYTNKETFDVDKALKEIEERWNTSNLIWNSCQGKIPSFIMRKFSNAQKEEKYCDDYIDVYDDGNGNERLVINNLVYLADKRGIEIKELQYKDDSTFYTYMYKHGYDCQPLTCNNSINNETDFLVHYNTTPVFEDRLKWCFEMLSSIPQLIEFVKTCPVIPVNFKRYLFELGPDFCQSKSYKEINLKGELDFRDKTPFIVAEIEKRFQHGMTYAKDYIKTCLSEIYKELGLNKNAKATDLSTFFPNVDESYFRDSNNELKKGFKIL